MRATILLQLLSFVFAVFPGFSEAKERPVREISFLSVSSAITPATHDYIQDKLRSIPDDSLVVLKLNTPGGLVSTTKDIITLITTSKKPFAVWITPAGASAASAGSIIASAAHFIFMSPGTNMGAATPVGLGEDIKESDGRKKALNDLSALVRSLSGLRGRPAAPFEKMITNAESVTSTEAQKFGIIDGIVSRETEIADLINKRTVNLDGEDVTLSSQNPVFKTYEQSLGQQILEVITNPSTAYILFILGIALIYFEFQAPGGYVAGAVGFCLLIIAAMAFQVLPLDWGSMGLILAGIFLLVLEIYVLSYGILTVSGLVAFVLGSLFLFHGESGYISVQYTVVYSSLAGICLGIGFLTWFLLNDRRKLKTTEDFFLPVGARGSVLTKLSAGEYQVKVRGEIWRAFSSEELEINDPIEVSFVDAKDLVIKIKRDGSQP